jgi:hypothetical protein
MSFFATSSANITVKQMGHKLEHRVSAMTPKPVESGIIAQIIITVVKRNIKEATADPSSPRFHMLSSKYTSVLDGKRCSISSIVSL